MNDQNTIVGMVGLYDSPDALLHAAGKVRQAGYTQWDCHTPYPVHGLSEAMGLKTSPVTWFTFAGGFMGLGMALAVTYGLNAWYYPIPVGGKPLLSWQGFVPVWFNMFVLFAAVGTLVSMVLFCRLGRWYSPLHATGVMRDLSTDRFALVLDARDAKYSETKARALLEDTACTDVRPLVALSQGGNGA